MSTFYIFKGSDCENVFINQYEGSYYLHNDDPKVDHKSQLAPYASQSSKYVEDEIDRVLKDGIASERDVIHILAWKMGKIKHKESENHFVYSKDWEKLKEYENDSTLKIPEDTKVKRYSKDEENFRIGEIAHIVCNHMEDLTISVGKGWPETLSKLDQLLNGISGLGTVYLITLMYFISKGKYPIYDKFAYMAVQAIKNGIMPGDNIKYKELKSLPAAITDESEYSYTEYQKCLETVFGVDYQYDNEKQPRRDFDRALWVYGHYFNPIKP